MRRIEGVFHDKKAYESCGCSLGSDDVRSFLIRIVLESNMEVKVEYLG